MSEERQRKITHLIEQSSESPGDTWQITFEDVRTIYPQIPEEELQKIFSDVQKLADTSVSQQFLTRSLLRVLERELERTLQAHREMHIMWQREEEPPLIAVYFFAFRKHTIPILLCFTTSGALYRLGRVFQMTGGNKDEAWIYWPLYAPAVLFAMIGVKQVGNLLENIKKRRVE